jgi:hypothetical protein
MTPETTHDLNSFRKLGMTFLPSFLGGAVGVLARYDLPQLYYPTTLSEEDMAAAVDCVNNNLRSTYSGCGYYGRCSQADSEFPDSHVYVIFSDQTFYDDYRSGFHAG